MRLPLGRRVLAVALGCAGLACGHTLLTKPRALDAVNLTAGPVPTVALLGAVDMRLKRGGGKTHERDVDVAPLNPDPYYARRYPYPLDPWNRYDVPPRSLPRESAHFIATGELGTQEVTVPLVEALMARLTEHLGEDNVRNASEDPLADEPDLGHAQAFLASYPGYDAVVWLEVLTAHATLPDTAALQSVMTLGACMTLGVGAVVFLVPVTLDTPVELGVRAYVVTREHPTAPLGTAVAQKLVVKARGSTAFDVDKFRADVADLVLRDAGATLADNLIKSMHLAR